MRPVLCNAAAALLAAWLVLPSPAFAQDFTPTEPQPQASEEWQDPDLDAFYPRRSHAVFKLTASGGARSLYRSLIALGGVEVAAGADTKAGSFYGAIGGAGGVTESGLSYGQFTVGPDLEWNLDILRLGVHPRIGYTAIGRVTEGQPFELFNWGLGALIGLDLYRSAGVVFAVGVEPKLEWASSLALFEDSDDAFIGGVNAVLQFRYRAARESPEADGDAR